MITHTNHYYSLQEQLVLDQLIKDSTGGYTKYVEMLNEIVRRSEKLRDEQKERCELGKVITDINYYLTHSSLIIKKSNNLFQTIKNSINFMATSMKTSAQEKFQALKSDSKTKSEVKGNGGEAPEVKKGSNFVYVDDLKKVLELAYATGENVILFGPGGHGKSEYTEHFFEEKGIEPFVMTMGSGTTTDVLFGGMDLKHFDATGEINYLVENSWMNSEYVVFEELMDAPDYILEQLKDILTSKKFRKGGQQFNIKTKLIVCATNRTREDFSKNDSLKALMERFPLEYKVIWDSYNQTTYNYMFQNVLGEEFEELSYILEKLAISGNIVSPRTAIKAARILQQTGDMDNLYFMADFSGKNRKVVQEEIQKFKAVKVIKDMVKNVNVLISEAEKGDLTSLDGIRSTKKTVLKIEAELKVLESKKVDDDMMKEINGRLKHFRDFIQAKNKQIADATEL